MILPNSARAIIEDSKLRDYLLNLDHPDGRGKAIFFMGKGYNKGNLSEFRETLILHAKNNTVSEVKENEWGTKYIVEGPIFGNLKVRFNLVSVWFIKRNENIPKFVTAYPF